MSSISFNNVDFIWIVLAAASVLLALSYLALRSSSLSQGQKGLAIACRFTAILLLAMSLLEPMWLTSRPKAGANIVAVLGDNSGSINLNTGEIGKSRGQTVDALISQSTSGVFAQLESDYQTRFYTFDRSLKRVADLSQLDYSGNQSNLHSSLEQLRKRFSKQPLTAAIILTDGNFSDLALEAFDPAGMPPLFFVPTGLDTEPDDIALKNVSVSQTPFDDSPVSIRASLAASGSLSTDTTVDVRRLTTESGLLLEDATDNPSSQSFTLSKNNPARTLTFDWKPAGSGIQFHEVLATPSTPALEATNENNRRIVMIDRGQKAFRLLYVSGRPNWEYKFLNRSLIDDPQLQMVGLIRVAKREPKFEFKGRVGESSNPLYRGFGREDEIQQYDQPVLVRVNARDEAELRGGFPKTEEELFEYDALIIDDLEADFFSYSQLSLIRRFVSDRGGGLLLLGGADALGDGGYQTTPLAAVLPVYTDGPSPTIANDQYEWKLTREGWVEPWTRIRPNETDERQREQEMPRFLVINPVGKTKPGAKILATLESLSGDILPGLVAQNFGSGRSACVPLGDIWRWGLGRESEQEDLSRFWRQIARWLVTGTPRQVSAVAKQDASSGAVEIEIIARDKSFKPLELGETSVSIKRIQVTGETEEEGSFTEMTLPAEPVAERMGTFAAAFNGRTPGPYKATITVTDGDGLLVGSSEIGWIVDPARKEYASLANNRPLMTELAQKTGGEVLSWESLPSVIDQISKLPVQETETVAKPIWHNGFYFLAALGCLLGEWAIRRKRGLA